MKMKRLLSLLLCLVLVSAFIIPTDVSAKQLSMSNFNPYTASYSYGQFSDVNEGSWYGLENQGVVATACGLGLMNGTGNGFSPDGNLTIAQVVTMAARLCSIYQDDGHKFVQGNPWYQCYVDYAEDENILYDNEFAGEMNQAATRSEMAYIFYYALPKDELTQINSITSLPDVSVSNKYLEHILCLYNAGILTGNDAYGTFTPDSPITRAAAAAIVSRMALPELRKEFTLTSATTPAPPSDPAALLDYSHYTSAAKPSSIDSYDDFTAAWEWMLVNTVFKAEFTSNITCRVGDISGLQEAAIEAFNQAATYNYFGYASFRRSVSILTNYMTTSSGQCSSIKFTLELTNVDGISNSTIKSQVGAFETACADIVKDLYSTGELKASMTNKQKAYVLYRYVVLNNAYDQSYKYYTGYDAAVRGTSVCQGYAGMYSYLCNLAGVPMRGITGMSGGDGHAWNRIYENGQWYYVDTTYADPTPDEQGYCDDSWFWLTRQQLLSLDSRTFDMDEIVYAGTFSFHTRPVSLYAMGETHTAHLESAA